METYNENEEVKGVGFRDATAALNLKPQPTAHVPVKAVIQPILPGAKEPVVVEPEPVEAAKVEEKIEEPQIDYAAELAKEKTRREKAEYALYKKNKESKQQKVEPEEQAAATTTVSQEVLSVLNAERQRESEETFEEELFALTADENERELIRLKYQRLEKSGFSRDAIKQDLDEARFLANRVKFERVNSELAKTAVSKRTVGNNGMGAGQDKPQAAQDLSKHFTASDWAFMNAPENRKTFTKEKIQEMINSKQR